MGNKYFLLRHGQALSNQKMLSSCWPEKSHFPLTEKGRKEIEKVAAKLKNKKPSTRAKLGVGLVPHRNKVSGAGIDFIFASDLLRTRQTAEIIGKELGINPQLDKRLREYNTGTFNGSSLEKFRDFFNNEAERWTKKPAQGETYVEITKRMYDFFQEIDKKYSNKNIVIVSHQVPLMLLEGKVRGYSQEQVLGKFPKEKRLKTGEIRELMKRKQIVK